LRWVLRAERWARVTGACFVCAESFGALDPVPCEALFRWEVPFQGTEFTVCHSSRPKSQVLREPPVTEPALQVIMKWDNSHSGAGILRALLTLKWSHNCVNLRTPVPLLLRVLGLTTHIPI